VPSGDALGGRHDGRVRRRPEEGRGLTGSAGKAVTRAVRWAEVVREEQAILEGEVVGGDMPTRKELILRGRIAMADLERNPDDFVDAATEKALRDARPKNTTDAIYWGWGRWIWWCGKTGRNHCPATPASVRQYIEAHKTMTNSKGMLRGRRGQPYAPATVELAVYIVSMVHQWMGYLSPVRHQPKVAAQLAEYGKWWSNQGFRPQLAYALTPEESVIVARTQDLTTIGGLRNATMLRLQYDMGCRADELIHLQIDDVRWETEHRVLVTISRSKTDQAGKGRVVAVEAVRDVDWDVDPVRLLTAWYGLLEPAGYTTGALFREVFSGAPRSDGTIAGRIKAEPMTYAAYEAAFGRAVRKSGVDLDPVTKKRARHVTTHSNRAGMITAAADAGMPLEKVAPRTGHSPASSTIHRYFRSGRKWGADNPGTLIRQVRRPKDDP
jgi:integrase